MSSLADQVHHDPVIFPLLEITNVELGNLSATQTAAEQERQDRSIALTV